jgi:hypothetical protein
MAELRLSFAPHPNQPPGDQISNLGNIADDVWPGTLALVRGMIADGRYVAVMQVLAGRPLRRKERDELDDRLKALAKRIPHLDPRVTQG